MAVAESLSARVPKRRSQVARKVPKFVSRSGPSFVWCRRWSAGVNEDAPHEALEPQGKVDVTVLHEIGDGERDLEQYDRFGRRANQSDGGQANRKGQAGVRRDGSGPRWTPVKVGSEW